MRWIDLKDTSVEADCAIGTRAREIRHVTPGRHRERKTIDVKSRATAILIYPIFKNGHRSQVRVIAAGNPEVGFIGCRTASTGNARAVNAVGAVIHPPEVEARPIAAPRHEKPVAKCHARVDVA